MPKATLASVWVSEVAISGRADDKAKKKSRSGAATEAVAKKPVRQWRGRNVWAGQERQNGRGMGRRVWEKKRRSELSSFALRRHAKKREVSAFPHSHLIRFRQVACTIVKDPVKKKKKPWSPLGKQKRECTGN
jgi:hypothetical protein